MSISNGVYYNIKESDYRAIPRDSYSTLKEYLNDRHYYYKKYVIKNAMTKKKNLGMIIGGIADIRITGTKEDFEEQFELELVEKPTGQWENYVENCIKLINKDTEDGLFKGRITDVLNNAFVYTAFDASGKRVSLRKGKKELTFEDCLDELENNNGLEYIKQYIKGQGKTLYSREAEESADKCAKLLMTHPNTSSLFRHDIKEDERYDVYDQLIVLFTYRGRDLKCKFDRVIVDKVTKRIILSDIKVVHNMKFFRSQFFNMKYYIQSALYYKAMEWLLENDWKEKYDGYSIMSNDLHDCSRFLFIVSSYSYTDPHDPLLFGVDQEMVNQGLEGWSDSYGNYVPGVDYAIMNLDWHERTGIWTTDMKNYNNKGFNKISGKVTPTDGEDE